MGKSKASGILPALFALLALGCGAGDDGGSDRDGRRVGGPAENLLLITVDTLRADALGFAGETGVETPALDRLAGAGRVFTNAHAHNVVTLPSHTNILTGLYPYQHGVRTNAGFELAAGVPTLATVLHDRGFATAAVVAAFPLDARFGLGQGFDLYDDDLGSGAASGDQVFLYSERRGTEVVERGLAWWRENAGRRRFLWLHLFEPHAPYVPPAHYAARGASAYLGEVATVDAYLAPLLARFAEGDEPPTAIVFTSDHGEALGEHGELTHGLFAYEPTLRVPLVVWGGGVEPGVDRRPAGHVDLLPTALDLLGLAAALPAGLPGRSLLAAADTGEQATAREPLYFESLSPALEYGWAPLRGSLAGSDKLIDLPIPELYDLAADPGETTNLLAPAGGSVAPAARGAARRLAASLPEESVWPPRAGAIGAETAERLRGLGYLGAGTGGGAAADGGPRTYGPEDDPKTLVALDAKLNRVASLYLAGRAEEALAIGWEIVAARPTMTAAYEYLVKIEVERGDAEGALRVLRAAEAAGAANPALRRQLALTLVASGRAGDAIAILERMGIDRAGAAGADPELLTTFALALATQGRRREALAVLDRALAAEPESAGLYETLSFVALDAERFERAQELAERATALDPARPGAWNNLAIAWFRLGRPGPAVEAWKRAANLDPRNLDVLFNLGLVAAENGDAATARTALERFLAGAPAGPYAAERRQARAALDALRPAGAR